MRVYRFYLIGLTALYFISWGYFDHWNVYDMLFVDWDVKLFGMKGVGTFIRLGIGFALLMASAASLATM